MTSNAPSSPSSSSTPTASNTTNPQMGIIIGATAAGVLVLAMVLVAIIVPLVRRRRKKKNLLRRQTVDLDPPFYPITPREGTATVNKTYPGHRSTNSDLVGMLPLIDANSQPYRSSSQVDTTSYKSVSVYQGPTSGFVNSGNNDEDELMLYHRFWETTRFSSPVPVNSFSSGSISHTSTHIPYAPNPANPSYLHSSPQTKSGLLAQDPYPYPNLQNSLLPSRPAPIPSNSPPKSSIQLLTSNEYNPYHPENIASSLTPPSPKVEKTSVQHDNSILYGDPSNHDTPILLSSSPTTYDSPPLFIPEHETPTPTKAPIQLPPKPVVDRKLATESDDSLSMYSEVSASTWASRNGSGASIFTATVFPVPPVPPLPEGLNTRSGAPPNSQAFHPSGIRKLPLPPTRTTTSSSTDVNLTDPISSRTTTLDSVDESVGSIGRLNTTVIGHLLKSRAGQRPSDISVSRSASRVSHIERDGSIKAVPSDGTTETFNSRFKARKGSRGNGRERDAKGRITKQAPPPLVSLPELPDSATSQSFPEDVQKMKSKVRPASLSQGVNSPLLFPLTGAFGISTSPSERSPATPTSHYPFLDQAAPFYAHTAPLKLGSHKSKSTES